MKESKTLALLAIATVAGVHALAQGTARADALAEIVAAKLAPALPEGLGVARVYPPASLATLDVAPDAVSVEMPRELRAGRASVRVHVRTGHGSHDGWVQVAYAALAEVAVAQRALAAGDVVTAGDVAIERRATDAPAAAAATVVGSTIAHDVPAGAPLGARDVVPAPPLARGSQVSVDVRRGNVVVHGTGTLELAARPGQPASARLAGTKTVVHGTLVAPATVEVAP